MKKIEWNSSFSVGIDSIDRQHQEFIRLVNRLGDTVKPQDSNETALRVLSELRKYADFHFMSEENFMRSENLPMLGTQEREHAYLLRTLDEMTSGFAQGAVKIAKIQLFLAKWLVSHILEDDREIGKHALLSR